MRLQSILFTTLAYGFVTFLSISPKAFAVDDVPVEVPIEVPAPACVPLLIAEVPAVLAVHELDVAIEQAISEFAPDFEHGYQTQFGSTAKILWQRFKIFRDAHSGERPGERPEERIDEIFSPIQLQTVFSDPRHYIYFKNLSKLLEHFAVPFPTQADPNPAYVRNTDLPFTEKLTTALRAILHHQVPEASIEARITALIHPENAQSNTLIRALGDCSVAEAAELYFGRDLTAGPTPESLVGQWMQANGVQGIRRRFPETKGSAVINPLSPERFVIPMDATGLPSFQQLMYGPNWLSIIGHATLVNGGKVFSYSSQAFSDYRAPNPGAILPVTLLSTSEAQRLWGYALLMNKYGVINQGRWGTGQLAQHPWEIPGFLSARNIYTCCTKWIGDMPIGDTLVDEYNFPGHRDQTLEVRARLQAHQHPDPLVRRIWAAPGHMQFSEMLGLKDAQIRGEFANTGWIYQVLLAQASLNRVPFVFYWTANQRDALAPGFVYEHEGAM